jgi:chromosomal replication initiation ATPase DnaA
MGLKVDDIDLENLEFNKNISDYTTYKYPFVQGITPNDVTAIISKLYGFSKSDLHIKFNHNSSDFRAICTLVMRNLCDLKLAEICNYIGNTSLSSLSYLCSKGYNLTKNEPRYNLLLENIISEYKIHNSIIDVNEA